MNKKIMNPLKIRMMKKKVILFATAIATLASCSSDEFIGDKTLVEANNNAPITFNSGSQGLTRADKTGSAAATDLNNRFYVYGIKNEKNDGAGNVQAGNLVYNNYVVKYATSTAYATTSNTQNWEYVGYALDANEQTQVVANSAAAAQTIKYWDWGAADYTFYAVSAAAADITAKNVTITKNQTVTSSVYDNGYTVALNASANLDSLFFAERVNITPTDNTDRNVANKYGGNVTFRFHNMATKVRVAMYETVPGYSVTIKNFSVVDSNTPTFATMTTSVTDKFSANLINNAEGTAGTMTIKYVASGTTQNYPSAAFAPTSTAANVLYLGTGLKKDVTIGTTASAPTWDNSGNYTSVFPNEANGKNLKLKVSYTLTAANTGETITITDATAEIPSNYLQWKPGYAYTYIFKISDNTNGYTGTSSYPGGLYPITFDAVEAIAGDGQAEYITTVSEPSITTFGVKDGKYVHGGNEYVNGSDIYATIVANSLVVSPTGKYKVYTVTGSGITEAGVAEAIAEKAIRKVTPSLTCTAYTTNVSVVTTVPGEDGVAKTVAGAIKMQAPAAATYAVAYKASAGSATAVTAAYDANATYYSMTADGMGFYPLATPTSEQISAWDSNKSNFCLAPTQPVYVYKVIVVQ